MRARALGTVGLLAALVTSFVIGTAAPASAHAGGLRATDYRVRITARPSTPGVTVRTVEAGWRLELTSRRRDVVVLGYEGEPYLRVGPGGVFENRRSPAGYLNANAAEPAGVSAQAPPRWERLGDGHTARWHDHRFHWMAAEPPEGGQAPWTLPLRIDGRAYVVEGVMTYVPGPPTWPWAVVAVVVLAGLLAAARRFGARRVLLVAVGVLVAADVARVAGLALAVAGGAGAQLSHLAAFNAVDAVGWGLGVAAMVRLAGHKPDGAVAAGATGVLLAVVGGALEWADLGRSQLAVAVPAPLARACIAVIAGLGLAIAVAVLAETSRRPPVPKRSGTA